MKIIPVGAELFHVKRKTDGQADGPEDGQTDRYDEANNRFLQFCERALKKGRSSEKPDTLRKKNGS
jgi:hypothetical protein